MLYATAGDMVEQFGEAEMLMLADRGRAGEIDAALVTTALQKASSEMDAYLAARYRLPLADIPDQLVDICCDIARYKLVGADATETDVARLRYKDAVAKLAGIRDRKLDIGLTQDGDLLSGGAGVQFSHSPRVFDNAALDGY